MRLLLSSFSIIIIGILISYFTTSSDNNSILTSFTTASSQKLISPLLTHTTKRLRNSPILTSLYSTLTKMTAQQPTTINSRSVQKFFLAREQAEGAGAKVRRSIGTGELRKFTPFLMLDHFNIAPGAGFPDHPHRGQETITYLLEGAVDHEDFAGNAGTIEAGDLQFMTAGRGIVHAEMPNPSHQRSVGLQLWVDLPKHLKYCEPRYRDLKAAEIPRATADNGKVDIKVISGRSHGVDSVKELAYTPVWIVDFTMKPGSSVDQEIPIGWNAFAYVLDADSSSTGGLLGGNGGVTFGKSNNEEAGFTSSTSKGPVTVPRYHNAVLERGNETTNGIHMSYGAEAQSDARVILIAGQPLDQETFQYGPFVLNNKQELYPTFEDYSEHKNGFERAKDWASEIGKAMVH